MDLRLTAAQEATAEEQAAVASVLGPAAGGWDGGLRTLADGHAAVGGHAARSRRHLLLPALHAVQDRVGWISPGALDHICARLTVPPAEAYGVASFYALFRTTASAPTVVHVCDDLACRVGGAEEICAQMERRFGQEGAVAGSNGSGVSWQRSPCLGQCDRGSAAMIQQAAADPGRVVLAPFSPDQIRPARVPAQSVAAGALADGAAGADCGDGAGLAPLVPQVAGDRAGLRLLRRIGQVEPGVTGRLPRGGRVRDARAGDRIGPAGVIREVLAAKLLGRGGAAFPTGRKWEAVAANPVRPHYVVCNADESEPGTFKDRVLMEEDPFAVLEGLTIAGFATRGRAGLSLRPRRVPAGRAAAAARGRRGRAPPACSARTSMGAGFAFDVELRRGAGAYICGEETALFNSIEGKRGEPRNKPPFPVQSGLFGKPTVDQQRRDAA